MSSIKDRIIGKLQREYVGIENRTDITDDEKVTKIINITASVCAGVAFQPIPFADIFILTPIQAYMGTRIAAVRGIPITKNDALTNIKEISGVVGLGLLAQQVAIGAYKTGLPGLGGFMTLPLVFGLTYGVGRVMDVYLVHKARGELINPETLKEIWKNAKKEGKSSTDKRAAKHYGEELSKESSTVKFVRTNFDEVLIIGAFASIQNGFGTTETDQAVLAAFQRYSSQTQDIESVQTYLEGLSEEQITGVVSSVKGILHEMEFVKIENSDGDSITAAMFPETNHKGFDVVMNDSSTGDTWEIQLKTTDNQEYVQEWLAKYPDGEILLSEEIASAMGLESSGFSNQELTGRVEDFVDQLISKGVSSSIWDLFPTLSLMSVSFVLMELYKRYQSGEISETEFKEMSVKATGIKVTKFALLMGIMCIPVVNVAVGAALVARVLYSLTSSANLLSIVDIPKELSKVDYQKPLSKLISSKT